MINHAQSELSHAQAQRRIAIALAGATILSALLFVDTRWRIEAPTFYADIKSVGTFLIFICILGRTWCTLYIGGRKKGSLVEYGPYSVSRNPLYMFSLIGALGVGMQTGSLLATATVTAATAVIFVRLVGKEEAVLERLFGDAYRRYAAQTPRFFPKLSGWRDVEELTIKPALMRQTFIEASIFLLAVPFADMIQMAQQAGWLPVLARIP